MQQIFKYKQQLPLPYFSTFSSEQSFLQRIEQYIYEIAILSEFRCGNEQERTGIQLEMAYVYKEAEYMMPPKYSNPMALPPHVKEAIKLKYEGGMTKLGEIMKSLVEDGIIEEGSFPKNKFHNHLKKLKEKLGVKKRSRFPLVRLEI